MCVCVCVKEMEKRDEKPGGRLVGLPGMYEKERGDIESFFFF